VRFVTKYVLTYNESCQLSVLCGIISSPNELTAGADCSLGVPRQMSACIWTYLKGSWLLAFVCEYSRYITKTFFTILHTSLSYEEYCLLGYNVNVRFGGTHRLHLQRRISRVRYQRESRWQAETSVNFQRTTWRYIPEDNILHNHQCENFRSDISSVNVHFLRTKM
jgi:hypothetical protein